MNFDVHHRIAFKVFFGTLSRTLSIQARTGDNFRIAHVHFPRSLRIAENLNDASIPGTGSQVQDTIPHSKILRLNENELATFAHTRNTREAGELSLNPASERLT